MNAHQLTNAGSVSRFALAGKATLTLRSKKTGTRFTYRIRQAEPGKSLWFVSLQGGNDGRGQYLGTLAASEAGIVSFKHGRKSTVAHDAPSVVAFAWAWLNIVVVPHTSASAFDKIEVWHEGTCGRCGRKLTVPESIESGLGPECASRAE